MQVCVKMTRQKVVSTNSKHREATLRSRKNNVYTARIVKGLNIPLEPVWAEVEWETGEPVVIGFEEDSSSQKTLEEQRKEFNDLQGGY